MAWNSTPNPVSAFTKEQNFAYRLHKALWMAFQAGAVSRATDRRADDGAEVKLILRSLADLTPSPTEQQFNAFIDRDMRLYLDPYFGLSEETIEQYFAPAKQRRAEQVISRP